MRHHDQYIKDNSNRVNYQLIESNLRVTMTNIFALLCFCVIVGVVMTKPQYSGAGGPAEPYNFQYNVDDPRTNTRFGQQENGDQSGNKVGSYYVLLPDGRTMTVNYVADSQGYSPKISFGGAAVVGVQPVYG